MHYYDQVPRKNNKHIIFNKTIKQISTYQMKTTQDQEIN